MPVTTEGWKGIREFHRGETMGGNEVRFKESTPPSTFFGLSRFFLPPPFDPHTSDFEGRRRPSPSTPLSSIRDPERSLGASSRPSPGLLREINNSFHLLPSNLNSPSPFLPQTSNH